MVSNLFEILKAMQIKSDEELFGKALDLMKEDDMITFLVLTASLLNPASSYAWSNVKYAFEYIVKEYKADKTKFMYLQYAFSVISAKLEVPKANEVNEAIKMLFDITGYLVSNSKNNEMLEQQLIQYYTLLF